VKKRTHKSSTFRSGSFEDFKDFSLAVVRGQRKVDPSEPKIWVEAVEPSDKKMPMVRFRSLEAGAKLLSSKNRALLRLIADQKPKSVSELAVLSRRAEQNLMRTLQKLSEAGLVRLDRGAGRAYQPVVTARRVHFEIDLLS
jgi:predicted transcriptional regulator